MSANCIGLGVTVGVALGVGLLVTVAVGVPVALGGSDGVAVGLTTPKGVRGTHATIEDTSTTARMNRIDKFALEFGIFPSLCPANANINLLWRQ